MSSPVAHPGPEVVLLGVPRWVLDKIIPGSPVLARAACRELPFEQRAPFIAGWLGQALAQQVDKAEAEYAEQVVHRAEHDEHSAPALICALHELLADSDPRPAICRLEEVLLDQHETPERRLLARAASEILAAEWVDSGPGAPIHHLPAAS